MNQPDQSMASSIERSVIRLHCAPAPDGLPVQAAEMFCQQFIQTLAENSKRSVIRRVPADQTEPNGDTEVSITLTIDGPQEAHLLARKGPHGKQIDGASHSFDASMASASPRKLKAFADALLKSAPEVGALLRDATNTNPQPDEKN
ncbi:hypothetical protein [Roseovarius sp.]|uniref:hypothetical protein n=1 Tax=Roseovarius sp. TaxID=1486281 RepID=UPI00356411DC